MVCISSGLQFSGCASKPLPAMLLSGYIKRDPGSSCLGPDSVFD